MTFKKARPTKVIHDIFNQIEEAIVDGRYKAGDRLPSERELCDLFEASRGTLREAFRLLEQKGLITVKVGAGGGTFVKPVTAEKVSESLDLLLKFGGVSLGELAEFREFLEGITAGLAAKRAKKEGIQQLKNLLAEAKRYLKEGVSQWDAFIRVDSEFHKTLAQITRNQLFVSVFQTVYENMYRYHDKYLPKEEGVMNLIARQQRQIVNAVEKGQSEKARLKTQKHVRKFNELAEENQRKLNGNDL